MRSSWAPAWVVEGVTWKLPGMISKGCALGIAAAAAGRTTAANRQTPSASAPKRGGAVIGEVCEEVSSSLSPCPREARQRVASRSGCRPQLSRAPLVCEKSECNAALAPRSLATSAVVAGSLVALWPYDVCGASWTVPWLGEVFVAGAVVGGAAGGGVVGGVDGVVAGSRLRIRPGAAGAAGSRRRCGRRRGRPACRCRLERAGSGWR